MDGSDMSPWSLASAEKNGKSSDVDSPLYQPPSPVSPPESFEIAVGALFQSGQLENTGADLKYQFAPPRVQRVALGSIMDPTVSQHSSIPLNNTTTPLKKREWQSFTTLSQEAANPDSKKTNASTHILRPRGPSTKALHSKAKRKEVSAKTRRGRVDTTTVPPLDNLPLHPPQASAVGTQPTHVPVSQKSVKSKATRVSKRVRKPTKLMHFTRLGGDSQAGDFHTATRTKKKNAMIEPLKEEAPLSDIELLSEV